MKTEASELKPPTQEYGQRSGAMFSKIDTVGAGTSHQYSRRDHNHMCDRRRSRNDPPTAKSKARHPITRVGAGISCLAPNSFLFVLDNPGMATRELYDVTALCFFRYPGRPPENSANGMKKRSGSKQGSYQLCRHEVNSKRTLGRLDGESKVRQRRGWEVLLQDGRAGLCTVTDDDLRSST